MSAINASPDPEPSPLPPLADLITEGGDERLDLLDNGFNKYLVNPIGFSIAAIVPARPLQPMAMMSLLPCTNT
jgi:hypothetical protein